MSPPLLPPDEDRRRDALQRYGLLDTPPEEAFDRITRLAARVFDVPVSTISLLGTDRVSFKSHLGVTFNEVDRATSFSAQAVLQEGVMVVEDALKDPRFIDSPYVAGPPHFRFYAGTPLRTEEGVPLGALCILDTRPRTLDAGQIATLEDLAAPVMQELALRREIAERRRVEQALLREKSFIDSAVHTLTDAFLVFDLDGRFLRWNRRAMEATGYDAEAFARMHPLDFFAGPQAERIARAIETVMAEGAVTIETEIRTKDGRDVAFEFNASLLHDADGGILGICSTGRDITERKRTEILQAFQTYLLQLVAGGKPLREVLETLVHFVEEHRPGLLAAIRLLDPEAGTLRYEVAPGLPPGYVEARRTVPVGPAAGSCGTAAYRGAPVFVRDVADSRLWNASASAVALAHGLRACWAVPIFARDRSVLGTLTIFRREPAEPVPEDIRVVEMAAQIAGLALQRHHAERALQESEERFRRLVQSVDAIVFSVAPEGTSFHFLSQTAARIYGRPMEELLADPNHWFSAIHPDDRERVLRQNEALFADGHLEIDYRIVRADGEVRWLHHKISLIYDAEGRAVQIAGIGTDITDRKEAEEALRRALERERELGELKSRFVSMVSHELRTPLATIQSSTELVGRFRHRWDDEKVDRHLERIRRNVRNMTEMLEDVLVLGKSDPRGLTFAPEPTDVHAFVEEVVEELRHSLGAEHELVFEAGRPVPEVRVDRKLLRNILHNLLSNAFKYSDAGSTVTLRLDAEAGAVRLSVEDRGIGIPPEDVPRLFEPFHRGTNVGTRRGTGLGLSIVRRAVDLHGGRLDVDSTPGRGTICTVVLPYSADSE